MLTFESKNREIRPYTKRTSRCPFYAFIVKSDVMIDIEENYCALAMIIARPPGLCQMEIIRDKPNWLKCPLNTEENGKKIAGNLEKIRVCPREYVPAKGKWDGWPLETWIKYLKNTTSIEG